MANFVKKAWLKIKNNPDTIFYIFFGLYFVLMLVLAYFRDMVKDEALYYREAWLISEVLRSGEWIGNYGVGLHGFLFKLPPALLFLITGPSIDIVTIYNILLGMVTGFLLFKLLKSTFNNSWFATFATVFMMTSFHFVLAMPTFLRDIPSLLMVVIFLYGVVKKWNKWWMSLVFLLLLDSKEYVFLIFAIFFVIWLFVSSKEIGFWKRIWQVVKTCVIVFLPSLVWIVLMFTTGIIPVNMYLASILGLVQGDLSYTLKHFSTDFNSENLVDGGSSVLLLKGDGKLIEIYNFVMAYLGKILYPRSFSFISVPKVVIFPVVYSSVMLVWKYIKSKKKGFDIFVFSALLILVWLLFYILRTSHGRYLLPILPFIGILLVYVFFFSNFTKRQKIGLISGTGIFVLLGFFFESSYVFPKIIIEIFLFIILILALLKPKLKLLKGIFISILSLFSLGVALLFSYTQGQINGYMNWGENREVDKVAKALPKKRLFWGNSFDNRNLLSVVNDEEKLEAEWKWELKDYIPKNKLLKTMGDVYSNYYLVYQDPVTLKYDFGTLRKYVNEKEIEKVVILYSTVKEREFENQFFYEEFVAFDWLALEQEVQLKNKIVYIFDVKD